VPTLVVARTDADSAKLITSDVDERDRQFIVRRAHAEGFYPPEGGRAWPTAIARGLAYAPYADMLWCETSHPDLDEAKQFAEAIHAFPGKLLAYNCSPSFNWKKNLDDATIAKFQRELGAMGYKFQFVTLAGFHSAQPRHVRAGARLQGPRHGGLQRAAAGEFAAEATATRRRATSARSAPATSTRWPRSSRAARSTTLALEESTEAHQF
jgi:isocitrate lyase